MKTMQRVGSGRKLPGPILAGLLTIVTAGVVHGQITWSGLGADDNWSTGNNWIGGTPPTVSQAALFTSNDVSGLAILTGDTTIAGLTVNNPNSGTVGNIAHTLDLGGNRLTVTGTVGVSWYPANSITASRLNSTLTVTNGTLQIGFSTTSRDLQIGGIHEFQTYGTPSQTGTLVMGSNSTFDAYLSSVTLGSAGGNRGILDLRLATVRRGGEVGVFRANSLQMAMVGHGNSPRWDSEILFGSSLTSFEIANTLAIASGDRTSGWIGKYGSSGSAAMPDGANIKLGVSTSSRASVAIGIGGYWGTSGHLVAGTGGSCTGYLSTVSIGTKGSGGNENSTGRLDLRNMASVLLDVSGSTVLGSSTDASKQGFGYLHLPAGTALFNTLTIGHSFGLGLLDLYGTEVTVTNALTVNATGLITNRVGAAGGSVTLTSNATLTVNGRIHLAFQADPPPGGQRNGLVWGGDRRATLQALLDTGKITYSTNGVTGTVAVLYDKTNTFVALAAESPLSVIPRNLTVEVRPGVATVLAFHIDDLDASPSGQGVTSRELTHPDDQSPADPYVVTLPAITLGSGAPATNVAITLTLHRDAQSASEDAIVTVTPVPDGVQSSLTWSGGASTLLMNRREWLWGQNWVGGVPPAAETTNTLTFSGNGLGTNILDQARRVGGLTVLNSSGLHRFDLNGQTLTVTNGTLRVGDQNTTTVTTFTNGTLRVHNADLIVDSIGGAWSQLALQGVALSASFRTLRLGDATAGGTGYGELDLRAATLVDGLLAAVNLEVGYAVGRENLTFPRGNLLVSAASGLQRVAVTGALRVSDGHRIGQSRFGDPSNGYKLPPGVALAIGTSTASRGQLRVGVCTWGGADGFLAATNGGSAMAWLSELNVGQYGTGVLDLQAMTNVTIDTTTLLVAAGGQGAGNGTVRLPAGTLNIGTLTCGTVGTGLIELYGTDATVTGAVTLGSSGTVDVRVGAASGSLSLGNAASLSLHTSQNRIRLRFDVESNGAREVFYGLKWAGDRVATLEPLVTAGTIKVEGALAAKVSVFLHRDDTYIGVRPPEGTVFKMR